MVTKRRSWVAASLRLGLLAIVAAAVLAVDSPSQAQIIGGRVEAVGGIVLVVAGGRKS